MEKDFGSSLFPSPTHILNTIGSFKVPTTFNSFFNDVIFEKLLPASNLEMNSSPREKANLTLTRSQLEHHDGYKLICEDSGITIHASNACGASYALNTLSQIIDHFGMLIPCFEIKDQPILKRRGFMLDVSRCKIPKMEALFELIDLLAQLRYNELQLYIEHTFAFKEHSTVWQNFTPFSAEEIRRIDKYCQDRFIELVPNLNSFGHFERWLRHEPYMKYAECPNGFQRNEPFMVRDHGSVLKPNQQSLDFIDSLYAEYLPNFSSPKFNVGLDEPWELGQGWSKSIVQERGKHIVYLEYLEEILKLVEKRGKSMEFWADVLLEKPANAARLPRNASPVIWGYEINHPFEEQAKAIGSCGLKFSLAPGTATWRSFSGRWKTARKNIFSACKSAKEYGAEGILLTNWGDCGNHQPWATMYPSLFHASQCSWNGQAQTDDLIATAMDNRLFSSSAKGLGKAIIDLARLDENMGFSLPNNSLAWFALFTAQPEKLSEHLLEEVSTDQLKNGMEWLNQLDSFTIQPFGSDSTKWAQQEWDLGIQLSKIGLERAMTKLKGKFETSQLSREYELIESFERIWQLRARKGGLHESIDLLKKTIL